MSHLSFFWLEANNLHYIRAIQSNLCHSIKKAAHYNKLTLPSIPDTLLALNILCEDPETTVHDVATLLLDDPVLTANIIRTANSAIFNRRNIICHDILTAVSRLGIIRIRDIITAQIIYSLKNTSIENIECNLLLKNSAFHSRQFAATMALICQKMHLYSRKPFKLEPDKALLTGLLADIGLFGLINEYSQFIKQGNYLDFNIAKYIFQDNCALTSKIVLKQWGFDEDYIAVATNTISPHHDSEINYLTIARMAHHLLLFKTNDAAINEHEIELDLTGAEVMYELTNMPEIEFEKQLQQITHSSGI
ncbi:HDOD domain-containing protein [Photobacterium piscicola]|uniref:HDOD domain-containing protein n=1 Tax=Photobacterium piscicola TaxID=1378299 RepID=A0ABU6LER5_9GAMM|nr:HDOD domain-containing protein [Photobacterium piscicola]MEC6882513.1 HDOD domain-containing protein [Photobacterium piscicola]MEC6898056.1 HDOD domain-containing protein [Photobacterium piscicola]